MKKRQAVIVGAGIGGITTGIYLAQNGCDVTILEKNVAPGGRCGNISKNGHRFDIGATLLMMPEVYRQAYRLMGRSLDEELELYKMDPVYRIRFEDREFLFSSGLDNLRQQIENIEPGGYSHFLEYMSRSYRTYRLAMKNIIDRNYYRFTDFFNPSNLFLLFRLNAFRNHFDMTGRYFKDNLLRIAFSFQNIYVGQNPYTASAVFAMLPFLELTEGVWFPKGGMYAVIQSLVGIAREKGIKIKLRSPVKSIAIGNNKAIGAVLQDDTFYPADFVIANADLPYIYRELLPESGYNRRLNRLQYTCSALVFHWGTDKAYPELPHHSVFVSDNYRKSINEIFNGNTSTAEPSFYVHAPARSDITAAPDGQDSLSVIVPVGNSGSGGNTDRNFISRVRRSVISRLVSEGLTDLEEHIKFELCYTPHTWESKYNLSYGATFGSLSHNLLQMGYMRPNNQHRRYRNLFFVGGSTHPGNGLPMSLISAKLTTEKILKQF